MFLNLTLLFSIKCDVFVLELKSRQVPHPLGLGSVELPKTTHLPKTTENHLENHIYREIIPS